eukprot:gb/GECG01007421.1/.p1 GENE.gb/GECG01007421.1/~~gb/GECG01007421.1/.p1  ORF type:complete len:372 (+),score=41.73 gb/GECG01007421.1/:1-1116(+)
MEGLHRPGEAPEDIVDPQETMAAKVQEIIEKMKSSNKVVMHIGAGVCTSCGLPDFRGSEGIWPLKEQGIEISRSPSYPLFPSKAHMALKTLVENNVVDFVVSQNADALHAKCGIPSERIADIHGNKYRETCPKCGAIFYRDFECRKVGNPDDDHRTGRVCGKDGCDGHLLDSVVNYGEDCPPIDVDKAKRAVSNSELQFITGSSMKVDPAFRIAKHNPEATIVIGNLRETQLDHLASVRVNGTCDAIMSELMRQLGYEIPDYVEATSLYFEMNDLDLSLTCALPGVLDFVRVVSSDVDLRRVRTATGFRWSLAHRTEDLNATFKIYFLNRVELQPLKISVRLQQGQQVEKVIRYNVHDPDCDSWRLMEPQT